MGKIFNTIDSASHEEQKKAEPSIPRNDLMS